MTDVKIKGTKEDKSCPFHCINKKILVEESGVLVDCPHCCTILRSIEKVNPFSEEMQELRIPERYMETYVVDSKALLMGVSGFSQSSLGRVSKYLDSLVFGCKNGSIPKLSTYIYLSNRVNSDSFVFGLQRAALEGGLSVSPYVSVNTLNSIYHALDYELEGVDFDSLDKTDLRGRNLLIAREGFKFMKEFNVDLGDFIEADLCVLFAGAKVQDRAWAALADLLGERSRRNRATVVFGYWSAVNSSSQLKYLVNNTNDGRLDLLMPVELSR